MTPSSSVTSLGSFYENDDASDVEILLAMGEGAVKKKRRPKRGEDFKIREALIKADFLASLGGILFLGLLLQFCWPHWLGCYFRTFCQVKNNSSNLVDDMCTYNYGRNVHSFFALALDGILYTATALLGISYGILYAGVLAGYVYDTETARQGSSTCLGPDCFKVNIPGSSWLSVDWEPS
uniref:Uncharacterized protein n=1 Tax=Populus alba TaxID=43335 RepID=A0A4U5P2I3_POPAL|nr:hypothetical protein D5086_0000238690 [Populus alba]